MPELDAHQMLVLKKALAAAIVAIDLQPGDRGDAQDVKDMKILLDQMTTSNGELALLMLNARIQVNGKAD